jgi:aminoglycoside phosphotransferase
MPVDPVIKAIDYFHLQVERIVKVDESYSSTVRILSLNSGERLVLKIPYVKRKLIREISALQGLKGDLPVPELVDFWSGDDETPGALLLAHLPGQIISGEVTPQLAFDLGALLGKLHTHELEHYGDIKPRTGESSSDWWAIMDGRFSDWKKYCMDVMPPEIYQKTLDMYARLSAYLPEPDGPCWVHHDYRPGNVLVEDNRFCGLIDFESARGGSVDLDFIKIKNEVWDIYPNTKEPFFRGYASIRPVPAIEQSLPYYSLYIAFGGIAWCVRRTDINDPFFEENMKLLLDVIYD